MVLKLFLEKRKRDTHASYFALQTRMSTAAYCQVH